MADYERKSRCGSMMTRGQALFAITRILEDRGFTVGFLEMEANTLSARRSEDSIVVFDVHSKEDDVYVIACIDSSANDDYMMNLEEMLMVAHDTLCAAQVIAELEGLGLVRKARGNKDFVKKKMLYTRPK